MTDYLEEAKSYVKFEGEDGDTWSEQVNAIRPIALTLIALVERLDATAQDVMSRVELASEITGLEFPDKLASIVLTNTNLLKVLNERIDKIETSTNRRLVSLSELLDGRLKKLEFGKVAVSKDGEVVGVYGGPPVEAQPALWEKLEQAKNDIMRFERRLIWRDEQLNKSQDYTKQLEYKLNKILEVAKRADEKDMSFLVLKDEIIKATY